jgi:hypothetical protein
LVFLPDDLRDAAVMSLALTLKARIDRILALALALLAAALSLAVSLLVFALVLLALRLALGLLWRLAGVVRLAGKDVLGFVDRGVAAGLFGRRYGFRHCLCSSWMASQASPPADPAWSGLAIECLQEQHRPRDLVFRAPGVDTHDGVVVPGAGRTCRWGKKPPRPA